MRIAYVLYDDITLLDFVGFYDPVSRLRSLGYLPQLSWDLCARGPQVTDNHGTVINIGRVLPDLSGYELVYVPGGFGTRSLLADREFLDWLGSAAGVPHLVSVCTGSLLLGAAGLLAGRRATTHFNEYDRLAPYVGEVVREELVHDGPVVTGGAVAAALHLGLYVAELLAGKKAAMAIRRSMNYR